MSENNYKTAVLKFLELGKLLHFYMIFFVVNNDLVIAGTLNGELFIWESNDKDNFQYRKYVQTTDRLWDEDKKHEFLFNRMSSKKLTDDTYSNFIREYEDVFGNVKVTVATHKISSESKKKNIMDEYSKGYQDALNEIKAEIEKEITDREKWLDSYTLEDYVSSPASTEHNRKIGLTIARNLINSKIENK